MCFDDKKFELKHRCLRSGIWDQMSAKDYAKNLVKPPRTILTINKQNSFASENILSKWTNPSSLMWWLSNFTTKPISLSTNPTVKRNNLFGWWRWFWCWFWHWFWQPAAELSLGWLFSWFGWGWILISLTLGYHKANLIPTIYWKLKWWKIKSFAQKNVHIFRIVISLSRNIRQQSYLARKEDYSNSWISADRFLFWTFRNCCIQKL